jgi:hypothetical protein
MNTTPKNNRGGKRPGAGRPPLPPGKRREATFPVRLHPSTIAALATIENKTALIETLIREYFHLPPL